MSFPPELKIVEGTSIMIDVPKDIFKDFKAFIDKWPKQPPNKIIVANVNRKPITKEIKGGNIELRHQVLVEALEHFGLYKQPTELIWPAQILHFIDTRVTPEMTQKEFEELPDTIFKQFQFYKAPETAPSPNDLKYEPITVGTSTAAFLLGTFGSVKDYERMNDFYRDDQTTSYIVQLSIPVPVYVLVTRQIVNNTFTFSFPNSEKLTAKTLHGIVEKILTKVEADKCLKMKLMDADQINIKAANTQIAQLDCYVSGNQELETAADDTPTSTVYILTEKEDEKILTEAAQKIFDYFELHMCKKCKCVYPKFETQCFITFHKGKQIPIEDDEMEIVDEDMVDENGEPIILQNWTCCGIIPADELGCDKKPNGQHEEDTAHPKISKFTTETVKYSRNF